MGGFGGRFLDAALVIEQFGATLVPEPYIPSVILAGTAIALFNIPTADPWVGLGRSDWQALRDDHSNKLIREALLNYPKSIDQKTESNGWIFLREGDVYIAIRRGPMKTPTRFVSMWSRNSATETSRTGRIGSRTPAVMDRMRRPSTTMDSASTNSTANSVSETSSGWNLPPA